ncbi:MAG: BolA family transcriptional regulator [Myxococcota bacterium]
MPSVTEIERRLRDLPADHVEVQDLTGGGDHFKAVVVSRAFEGKTRIQQHQLVYGVLGEAMKGAIHALSLRTFTPEQWETTTG